MKDKYLKGKQYSEQEKNRNKEYMSVKSSIFNTLKSLFSNQAVIDGRRKPLFFIIILSILFTFISWIAPLSVGYTTKSANFLNTINNNGIDHGFKMALNKEYFDDISLAGEGNQKYFTFNTSSLDTSSDTSDNSVTKKTIDFNSPENLSLAKGTFVDSKEKKVDYSSSTGQIIYPNSESIKSFSDTQFTFYVDSLRTNKLNLIDNNFETSDEVMKDYVVYLEVYILPELSAYSDEFALFQSNFLTTLIYNTNNEGAPQKYPHSVFVICKDAFRLISYPIGNLIKNTNPSANYFGYTGSAFNKVENSSQTFKKYLYSNGQSDTSAFETLVYTLNEGSFVINVKQAWINIGIMSGVALGSMLVTSLLVFLLERRKTSIVKSNLYEAFVQGVTLCTTPCLLSLLGFMSFSFGIIGLAGFALMRVLFMNSKISPPRASDKVKPLYKAKTN